ncbi:MAG TPA: Ppx/GppA phosphatase family protein [Candidatus Deferrimicrobiaceae bacterium]
MKPKPRTLAAIDVGTNTLRMLVGSVEGRSIRPDRRMRRITGMGKALRESGRIGEQEFRASLEALREFREEMDRLGVVEYRACGTAALRESGNREEFLEQARRIGVRIAVLSARDEARYTWNGISEELREDGAALVLDIGGGSTEFIAGTGVRDVLSLPVGVVVLSSLFPLSDPPKGWQLENLGHFLKERIDTGATRWNRRRFGRLVGTAGTFTTLAALDRKMRRYRPERIDGIRMPIQTVRRWAKRLCGMTDAGRLALPGMEKGRERYIVPGILLAQAAMERFRVGELRISDAGLLEGILRELGAKKGRG